MRRLLRKASAWGLNVEWAPLGDQRGFYEHDVRTITLNSQMPDALLRSTLAHELGHAHYGHTDPGDPRIRERHEQLANRFGADMLVTDHAYAMAEAQYGPHAGAIACALEVATYTIETWQEMRRLDQIPRRLA
jgi:Zn-dependent peptidase ImmA (M78 family)